MAWVGLAALAATVGYFIFEFFRIKRSQRSGT